MNRISRSVAISWLAMAAIILVAAGLRFWQLPALPPGLTYDEAMNGADIRMLQSSGSLPIYFLANNGREPLFIYLQALFVALLGARPLALRLTAAVVGILSVPILYYCARWLLPAACGPDGQDLAANLRRPLALLAAVGLAVSYWHVSLSRLGLRAILLVPLSALAITYFWKAWTSSRLRNYAIAAIFLSLSLYSYTAARLLPLVPALFVLTEIVKDAWRSRHRSPGQATAEDRPTSWRGRLLGLGCLAAVYVALGVPLLLASLQNPLVISGRASQVSVVNAGIDGRVDWQRLGQNVLLVARSFYDRGDIKLVLNLPNRPVNDLLLAVLFTLGWLFCLWRIRDSRPRLLLLWFLVMLLPTIFSTEAPHALRSVGALPPLVILYAVGAEALLAWYQRVRPGNQVQVAWALPVILVLVSGTWTAHDYFGTWATARRLGEAFDVQNQLAAQEASRLINQNGQSLLVPYVLYNQPQLVFALGSPQPSTDLPLNAGQPHSTSLISPLPANPDQPFYLLWREGQQIRAAGLESSPGGGSALGTFCNLAEHVVPQRAENSSWPRICAGTLPGPLALIPKQIRQPLNIRFANGMRLAGYDVWPDEAAPGKQFQVTLFWQLDEHVQRNDLAVTQVFLHLANAKGVWATRNGRMSQYYTELWPEPSHMVEDIRILNAPVDMNPGKARLEVGLELPGGGEDLAAPERVDIVDAQGRAVADRVDLGAVMVGQPVPHADLSSLRPLEAHVGDQINLRGYRVTQVPGQPNLLEVSLGWEALGRPASNYRAFVHLLDAQGQILAQHDEAPGGDGNPTGAWVPGETILGTFGIPLPPDGVPSGSTLRIGLYEPVSGSRLRIKPTNNRPVQADQDSLVLPLSG